MKDQIRALLLRRIVSGVYAPGERLLEMGIAREMNTSQAPVREALRELEALRVVETERYRGTRVRRISDREMHEAFYVRGLLDEAAARLAAPSIQKDSSRLRHLLDKLLKAAKRGQPEEYAQANHAFHRAIVEASGNQVLLKIWDSLSMESLSRLRLVQIGLRFRKSAPEHAGMVEALERGDGPLAGRLLRRHAHSFLGEAAQGAGGAVRRPGKANPDDYEATRVRSPIASGKRAGESEEHGEKSHGNAS
jgi:DNA-binding GntR family transcriptional regulator